MTVRGVKPWTDRAGDRRSVLLFATEPLWVPHFETELEIAMGHQDAGDSVIFSYCRRAIPSCVANPDFERYLCVACMSRRARGLDAAGVARRRAITPPSRSGPITVPEFTTIDDVRQFEFDGQPIGQGIASSLISLTRDSSPSLSPHRDLIERLVATGIGMYRDALRAISDVKPDLVYVFNGRFASTYPLLLACKASDVHFYTYEAAYDLGRYRLVEGAGIHDLAARKSMIEQAWKESDLSVEDRLAAGRQFFEGRRFGGEGDAVEAFRFTASQRRGLLPAAYRNPSITWRISVFNSSEDELAALADYRNPAYRDQIEALRAIVTADWPTGVHLCLRAHPNLTGVDSTQTRAMRELSHLEHFTLIEPDDPVDSYALMEASDVVITFGSTAGIEAVYWGTPSILVGRQEYEDLGCIRPSSHDEVLSAATLRHPRPDMFGALKYGYAVRHLGFEFDHIQQTSRTTAFLNGVPLRPGAAARLVSRALHAASASRQPSLFVRLARRRLVMNARRITQALRHRRQGSRSRGSE